MKPGYRSTEFYFGLASALIGLTLIYVGFKNADQALIERGFYLLLGSQLGYTLSRGLAKAGKPTDIANQLVANAQDVDIKQVVEEFSKLFDRVSGAPPPALPVEAKPTDGEAAPK